MLGAPDIGGRFFYNDDLSGFNFQPVRIKLDAVLDEIARHEHDRESPPAIYVGSTTVDTCLPGFRAENDLDIRRSPAAREHLARQSHAHRRSSRRAGQPRLRRRRPSPLHAVPARAAGESLHRSARLHAGRPGDQPGRFRAAGFRAIPEVRRGAAARAGRRARARAMRSSFPACGGITSRRSTAFNVLVNYWWRQSPAFMDSPMNALMLAIMTVRDLPPEQRAGVAEPVPSLRLRGGRAHGRPHSAAGAPRARRRWMPNRRASCAHGCCRD